MLRSWAWDEAFHVEGFDSGAALMRPEEVEEALRALGCSHVFIKWGGSRANHYIAALTLPDGSRVQFSGRRNPAKTLPADIVARLDERFGPRSASLTWDKEA